MRLDPDAAAHLHLALREAAWRKDCGILGSGTPRVSTLERPKQGMWGRRCTALAWHFAESSIARSIACRLPDRSEHTHLPARVGDGLMWLDQVLNHVEAPHTRRQSTMSLTFVAFFCLLSAKVQSAYAQLPVSCLCVDTLAHFQSRASQLYLDDLDARSATEARVGEVARAALIAAWENVQRNGNPEEFAATLLQEHRSVCSVRSADLHCSLMLCSRMYALAGGRSRSCLSLRANMR